MFIFFFIKRHQGRNNLANAKTVVSLGEWINSRKAPEFIGLHLQLFVIAAQFVDDLYIVFGLLAQLN